MLSNRVLIVVNSVYQLITAIHMKRTILAQRNADLLLTDMLPNGEAYLPHLQEIRLFDRVIFARTREWIHDYISCFYKPGPSRRLLGSAWPSMYQEFQVPVSYAGIISMIISGGTIVSSLQSDRLTLRLGPGKVTALSVAMTAAALFGFSFSHSFSPYVCGLFPMDLVPEAWTLL